MKENIFIFLLTKILVFLLVYFFSVSERNKTGKYKKIKKNRNVIVSLHVDHLGSGLSKLKGFIVRKRIRYRMVTVCTLNKLKMSDTNV